MARKPVVRRGESILTAGCPAVGRQPSPTVAAGSAAAGSPAAPSKADDPCDGLFAVMDWSTVADRACAVTPGRLLTGLGNRNGPV